MENEISARQDEHGILVDGMDYSQHGGQFSMLVTREAAEKLFQQLQQVLHPGQMPLQEVAAVLNRSATNLERETMDLEQFKFQALPLIQLIPTAEKGYGAARMAIQVMRGMVKELEK